MAIRTVTTKQIVVEVSREVAAKVGKAAKDNKMKVDDYLVSVIEEAVKDIEVPAKKTRAKEE